MSNEVAVIQSPAMTLRRSFWPTAITLFGAFLRWHRLGDTRVWWDHSYPIAQALLILVRGEWPVLGQPSTFVFRNPPGQAYISLPPLIAFGSPWGVHWLMAALNVLAVPLVYRLGRERFNESTGLAAALLFAVSPWVVLYSRTTWTQALAPLFSTVVLYCFLCVSLPHTRRRGSWALMSGMVALAAFTQTYLLALATVPMQLGALFLLGFKRVPWRRVLANSFPLVALAAVYAINSARDWSGQSARWADFVQAEGEARFKPQAFQLAARYVTGLDYPLFSELGVPRAPLSLPMISFVATSVLVAALAVGLGLGLRSCLRRDAEASTHAALLAWWLVPIALLSFNNHPLHDWHLILSLPAGHLLAGRALGVVLDWRRLSTWAVAILVGSASLFTFNAGNLRNAAHPAAFDLDNVTLDASLRLGEAIHGLATEYGVEELYAGLPEPSIVAWSQKPLKGVHWFIDPDLLIVPQGRPAVYMRLGHGAPPAPYPLAERVETIAFPGDDVAAFDVFPALDRSAMLALPRVRLDWPSDTGLTLLGYTASDGLRAGGTVTVTTYWLTEALAEARGDFIYAPYMHLDAVDGPVHLNVSAPGLPGYYYRMGDLYVQPLTFTLPEDAPAGEYRLELGLYDGVHSVGTTFHPPDGVPVPFHVTWLTVP